MSSDGNEVQSSLVRLVRLVLRQVRTVPGQRTRAGLALSAGSACAQRVSNKDGCNRRSQRPAPTQCRVNNASIYNVEIFVANVLDELPGQLLPQLRD